MVRHQDDIFEDIYQKNAWNGTETRSGPGSGMIPTAWISTIITMLCQETTFEIKSILDVGCGEGLWQPELPGYVGVDVSPFAIDRAREFHSERTFGVMGPGLEIAKKFDMILCRDVFQHLSFSTGSSLLGWIMEHAAHWLLISNFSNGSNVDIPEGFYYRPDMRFEPWNLGAPLLWISDGFDIDSPEVSPTRDTTKFLALWDVEEKGE